MKDKINMVIKNIYGETFYEKYTKSREGCRGIVVRDGFILLSYEQTTDFWVTPGGGIEPGETLNDCCVREIEEETGYIVKPLNHYLILNEYYDEWKYINNYFICKIKRQGSINLTKTEAERKLTHKWISVDKALKIFSEHESYREVFKDKQGSYLRDYYALLNYLSMTGKTYNMKLKSVPFNKIKSGQKTIELRLFDEKRQQLKIGDKIIFTNMDCPSETVTAQVINLHCFESFMELYNILPLEKCGYLPDELIVASYKDMEAYYSIEEQKKYGVVGIELTLLI